ncbi:hypothetical protein PG988_016116 [Apiospora saccharicola]
MPGMVIDIQPPSVARRGRVMRPQMVVSLPGDTVCSFVHCTIQTAGGAPVGDIMQGGTQANSTSSRPARRGRQYSIFFNLSIHEVGRFVITVHASCTNDEGGQYVDDVTSEVVEEKLMDKLDNAGFFAS